MKGAEFDAFYRAQMPAVYRATLLLCGSSGLAEEATQEAFARALARWRQLSREAWAGGWVMTTSLNVARRSMRQRREPRHPVATIEQPLPDPQLWDAIRELPRRQQEALCLRYVADLPLEQVAEAMRCSPNTAKTHLRRATTQLQGVLGGDRR